MNAPHLRFREILELSFLPSGWAFGYLGFEIPVQMFIRVEFGTVAGQVVQFDFFAMLIHPFPDGFAMVCGQVVEYQKDFFVSIPDEASHELDEHRGVHPAFVEHEADFAELGDGGDHVDTFPLAHVPPLGGLSPGGVAPSYLILTAYAGFIAPVDLGLFLQGPGFDGRVFFPEPLLYFFLTALICPLNRFLWGETPLPEVMPHRPYRHPYPEKMVDEFLHRCPRPECKVEMQLVRRAFNQARPDLVLHLPVQGAATALGTARFPHLELPGAPLLPEAPPFRYGVAVDPDDFTNFSIGHALLT